MINKSNIFSLIPKDLPEELFEDIISTEKIKIERIISKGNISNEWYEQDKNEWVILLKGGAILSFENEDDVSLNEGDYINIPAYKKHKVSWTKEDVETIWLAVFY